MIKVIMKITKKKKNPHPESFWYSLYYEIEDGRSGKVDVLYVLQIRDIINWTSFIKLYHHLIKSNQIFMSSFPPQVLAPSDFGLDLKTFGFAVSGGIDMDDNMYPGNIFGPLHFCLT